MLSSSVSDVRQTKVYDICFRVPAFARAVERLSSRSLRQKTKPRLTTKVNVDRPQPGDNSGCSQNCTDLGPAMNAALIRAAPHRPIR
jgi:hypothetical protein